MNAGLQLTVWVGRQWQGENYTERVRVLILSTAHCPNLVILSTKQPLAIKLKSNVRHHDDGGRATRTGI